jgi:hypothetical protein
VRTESSSVAVADSINDEHEDNCAEEGGSGGEGEDEDEDKFDIDNSSPEA